MNQVQPLVSIGVPVRNGERYIGRALESLIAQRYENIEILISDNASTDRTWEICRRYADQEPRIRVSRNSTNVGGPENFRRVLTMASGSFFMWAAHDDQWEPAFLPALTAELQRHPEAAVAMSAIQHCYEDGTLGEILRFTGRDDPMSMSPFRLAWRQAGGGPLFQFIYGLYRRECLERLYTGLPEVPCSDGLFAMRLALASPVRYVDRVLAFRQITGAEWIDRYPLDKMARRMASPWGYFLTVAAALPYLLGSRAVPWRRRVVVPLLVARLAAWLVPVALGEMALRRRPLRRRRPATRGSARAGTQGD